MKSSSGSGGCPQSPQKQSAKGSDGKGSWVWIPNGTTLKMTGNQTQTKGAGKGQGYGHGGQVQKPKPKPKPVIASKPSSSIKKTPKPPNYPPPRKLKDDIMVEVKVEDELSPASCVKKQPEVRPMSPDSPSAKQTRSSPPSPDSPSKKQPRVVPPRTKQDLEESKAAATMIARPESVTASGSRELDDQGWYVTKGDLDAYVDALFAAATAMVLKGQGDGQGAQSSAEKMVLSTAKPKAAAAPSPSPSEKVKSHESPSEKVKSEQPAES